jgi:hypothetical protein
MLLKKIVKPNNCLFGRLIFLLCVMFFFKSLLFAQASAFTYQGRLNDGSVTATGQYDFQFKLFDALASGTQIGSTQTITNVQVTGGVFTVQLDFGASAFQSGADRYLEISVKQSSGSTFTTLSPRQKVTGTPYTIRSANAGSADGLSSSCIGCIDTGKIANNTVVRSINGLSDNLNLTAGSNINISSSSGNITVSATGLLSAVSHNTTLSGSGTSSSPLSVAVPLSLSGSQAQATISASNNGTGSAIVGTSSASTGAGVFGISGTGGFPACGGSGVCGTSIDDNGVTGISSNAVSIFGLAGGPYFPCPSSAVCGTTNSKPAVVGYSVDGIGIYARSGASLTMKAESSSDIGTWLQIQNTSAAGRSWNLISTGSNNGEGPGRLLFYDSNAAASRMWLNPNGVLTLKVLGSGGSTDVCLNGSDQLSTCSSSLRYKTEVSNYAGGLNIVRRLQPISFKWISGGSTDVGFAAEDVEKIDPLLATTNENGEAEGVRYKQLTAVLVNAIKEQQQIIEQQQKKIEALQAAFCQANPQASICK